LVNRPWRYIFVMQPGVSAPADLADTVEMVGKNPDAATESPTPKTAPEKPAAPKPKVEEIGGPKGPEPTRYGDWEVNGRVSDF
jgi:hypothetical protein